MAERVVYRSATFDPATRLPVVVINSTAFPSSAQNYTPELMAHFIERLPSTSYALVFFACGAPNTPSWSWITKMHDMLSRDVKKRVGKVYVVHESWWVRAVTEMFRGIISTKFREKMVHISTLSDLAKHVDITQINIPPAVYIYNARLEDRITIPKHYLPIFGVPLHRKGSQVMYPRMWEECCSYLRVAGTTTRSIFQLDEQNEVSLILRDAYDRGQILHLPNYGPHHAACIIKLYLQELPSPILPVTYIPAPLEETPEYCVQVYTSLPFVTQKFLFDLIPIFYEICRNHGHTGHDSSTLSLCMTPSFIGRYASIKESMAMAMKYTKCLIDLWPEVMPKLLALAPSQPPPSLSPQPVPIPEPQSQTQPESRSQATDSVVDSASTDASLAKVPMGLRTPSGSSVSSLESADSITQATPDKKAFTTLQCQSDEFLSSPGHRSAGAAAAGSSTSGRPPISGITPGLPKLRKSASTILRRSNQSTDLEDDDNDTISNKNNKNSNNGGVPDGHRRLFTSRTFSEMSTHQQRSASVGGGSRRFLNRSLSTKRGRMVSELAKLYED